MPPCESVARKIEFAGRSQADCADRLPHLQDFTSIFPQFTLFRRPSRAPGGRFAVVTDVPSEGNILRFPRLFNVLGVVFMATFGLGLAEIEYRPLWAGVGVEMTRTKILAVAAAVWSIVDK